jgi:hypothetical protein
LGFPNHIAIPVILRIVFGFFQVFYAICRDFLGLGILGFSKILGFFQRFFLFLMKCTKTVFRVIYPSHEVSPNSVNFR